jgi:putative intracellular protease/amidase
LGGDFGKGYVLRIALFYYDGFAEFEMVLAGLLFQRQHEILAVALENREYRSEEKQRYLVDQAIRDVDVQSIDLLIIPGGNPGPLFESEELKSFIEALLDAGKKVGGICGGACLLAGLGVLDGKRCTGMTRGEAPDVPEFRYFADTEFVNDHVVVDGNLITAQGQAYAEFAMELARQMGLCKSDEEYREGVNWLKNVR